MSAGIGSGIDGIGIHGGVDASAEEYIFVEAVENAGTGADQDILAVDAFALAVGGGVFGSGKGGAVEAEGEGLAEFGARADFGIVAEVEAVKFDAEDGAVFGLGFTGVGVDSLGDLAEIIVGAEGEEGEVLGGGDVVGAAQLVVPIIEGGVGGKER